MKRAKIKKRRGVWYVYRDRKKVFTCYNINSAKNIYKILTGAARA